MDVRGSHSAATAATKSLCIRFVDSDSEDGNPGGPGLRGVHSTPYVVEPTHITGHAQQPDIV